MQAVRVIPGTAGSAKLDEVPEPAADLGSVVVEALAVGVCGTDAEIAGGSYGWAPPGEEQLILGHESLGRVLDPGPTGLAVGEHVVGIVRRPDPTRCPARTARWASGTCAPTAATPSAASSRSTASWPSAGGSNQSMWSGSTRISGCWGSSWNPRPSSPRRGSRSPPSASAPSGTRTPCWSSGRARSGCWPRWQGCIWAGRCMCSTGSRPVRNRYWSSSWAPSTTPARWPSWGCTPTS
jgi:hypothetical protein